MKILKLAFTLTLLGASAVSAAEGSMSCKVKSNSVTSVKEGKPEFYTGYKEQFEVGDTLTLSYSSQGSSGVYIELVDDNRGAIVINSYFSDIENPSKDRLRFQSPYSSGSFSQDHLTIDQGIRRLTLLRYYKSDWHGLFVSVVPIDLTVQVVAVDCRTITDSISEVIGLWKNE